MPRYSMSWNRTSDCEYPNTTQKKTLKSMVGIFSIFSDILSVNENYVIVNVPLNLYYSFNGTIDLLVCNSPGDFNQIIMFLVIWTKLLVLLSITVVLYLVWLRCSVLIIVLFMNTILKFSFIKKAYICYFDGSVLPKNFSFAFYDCSHQSMIRFVLVQ